MAKISFTTATPTNKCRSDLAPGTLFVYTGEKRLCMVPQEAFSRHNVANKDIVISGDQAGSLEDYRPSALVSDVDLMVHIVDF